MFLKAAKSTVRPETLEAARATLDSFEEFVQRELGNWGALDAVISEWLPEERQKFELANKQAVFKGLSNVLGVWAQAELQAQICVPDASGDRCDSAMLHGLSGLQQLRPSASFCFATMGVVEPSPEQKIVLEGLGSSKEVDSIRCWSLSALPRFHAAEACEVAPTFTMSSLENGVGPKSAIDVYAASVYRGGLPRYRPDPPRVLGHGAIVTVPVKTLIMDVLVHKDLWVA